MGENISVSFTCYSITRRDSLLQLSAVLMVIISLANKYVGEKHLMNVLLYQHVRSSVSSCSICPRWERLDAVFGRLPDVSLRSEIPMEACRERKELHQSISHVSQEPATNYCQTWRNCRKQQALNCQRFLHQRRVEMGVRWNDKRE